MQTFLWRTLPGPQTFLTSGELSGAMVTVPPHEVAFLGPVGFLSLADPALGNCTEPWEGLFIAYSKQALTITVIGFPPYSLPLRSLLTWCVFSTQLGLGIEQTTSLKGHCPHFRGWHLALDKERRKKQLKVHPQPLEATPSPGSSQQVVQGCSGSQELLTATGAQLKGRAGWERTWERMNSESAKVQELVGANLEPEPGTGTDSLQPLFSGQEQNDGALAASGGRGVTPNVEECIRRDK